MQGKSSGLTSIISLLGVIRIIDSPKIKRLWSNTEIVMLCDCWNDFKAIGSIILTFIITFAKK